MIDRGVRNGGKRSRGGVRDQEGNMSTRGGLGVVQEREVLLGAYFIPSS